MAANIIKGIVLVCVIVVIGALLLPAVQRARPAAKRTQCKNNLKQIMLGLHQYESEYGAFPPAYTVDSEGRPLHSWRTLILPYIDHRDLYRKIDLSKPWNDPVNKEAYNTTILAYCCPSVDLKDSKSNSTGSNTTYLAAVTEDSCLRATEPRKLKEITDGANNTLAIFEVGPEQAVHWMQPTDANLEMILKLGALKKRAHVNGTQLALADGSVRFISSNTTETTLRALITADGGETIGDF